MKVTDLNLNVIVGNVYRIGFTSDLQGQNEIFITFMVKLNLSLSHTRFDNSCYTQPRKVSDA